MTDIPNILILDVGHGNSALVVEPAAVTVIDVAPGPIVSEALRQADIVEVGQVIISHADNDHCGGLVGLLLDEEITIDTVWINTDVSKTTRTWEHLLRALADARKRKNLKVLNGVTTDHNINGFHELFRLEVLAPSPMLSLGGGPGTHDHDGRQITTNSMSAVIRVWYKEIPFALFAADIDDLGLGRLLSDVSDLRARTLVFPHHGGLAGGAEAARFAATLASAARPELVVFSIGRGRFANPNPEIVAAIKSTVPEAHIACTQLSEHCAANVPETAAHHLSGHASSGAARNMCCGGTLDLDLEGESVLRRPTREAHQRFVQISAATALCIDHPPDAS